jgi:aryl-alcohol dehydrogenase-like predicted oxidoreductase
VRGFVSGTLIKKLGLKVESFKSDGAERTYRIASQVLKGRRDKIYFGYDWWAKGPIFPEWRSAQRLLQGLDENLKQAGLDYVDIWRITLPQEGVPDLGELQRA